MPAWKIVSTCVDVQGNAWNLHYGLVSGVAKDEALRNGLAQLRADTFTDPERTIDKSNRTVCTYRSAKTNNYIDAYHPPVNFRHFKENTDQGQPSSKIFYQDSASSQVNHDNQINSSGLDLQGKWFHDSSETLITRQGNDYTFCNEGNNCAQGSVTQDGIIKVPQWQVTGVLVDDGCGSKCY